MEDNKKQQQFNAWPGSNFHRPTAFPPFGAYQQQQHYRMPFHMNMNMNMNMNAPPRPNAFMMNGMYSLANGMGPGAPLPPNPPEMPKPIPAPDDIPLPEGPPPEKPPLPYSMPPNRFQMMNPRQQNNFTPFALKKKKKQKKKAFNQGGNWFNNAPEPSMAQNQVQQAPPPIPMQMPTSMSMSNPASSTLDPSQLANPLNTLEQWPPKLNDYVTRAYKECETDLDKDLMGIMLRGKITQALNKNELSTRDWDNEPIPMLTRKFLTSAKEEAPLQPPVAFKIRQPDRAGVSRNYRMGGRRSRSSSRSHQSHSQSRSRSRSLSRSRSRSSSRNSRRKRNDSQSTDDKVNSFVVGNFNKKNASNQKKKKQKNKKANQNQASSCQMVLGCQVNVSEERLKQRAARFTSQNKASSTHSQIFFEIDTDGDFPDITDCHVVGTCTDLEKPFLRLTSAPDSSQVRPLEILRKSLAMVLRRWNSTRDYHYTCEQLKSIRQDLTVQAIRDEFAVEVYETHARICLDKGDPEEFNQCQTQLRMLYADLGGDHKHEFTAYRILYYLYTKNTQDLTNIIGQITSVEKLDPCISHALNVAHAWYTNNFHRFFQLYRTCPKMTGQLMGWFLERERKTALKTLIKAFRQTLPVVFVADRLAFESVAQFLEFAAPFNLSYSGEDARLLDCKTSMAVVGAI